MLLLLVTMVQVVGLDAVRNTLTLMHSCGMYDSAGEFSFAVSPLSKHTRNIFFKSQLPFSQIHSL